MVNIALYTQFFVTLSPVMIVIAYAAHQANNSLTSFIKRIVCRLTLWLASEDRKKVFTTLKGMINLETNTEGIKLKKDALNYLLKVTRQSRYLAQYIVGRLMFLTNKQQSNRGALLREVYCQLGLNKLSQRKLMNGNIAVVIKGIQEIAELGSAEDVENIEGFLHHYDQKVRIETQKAVKELSKRPCPLK